MRTKKHKRHAARNQRATSNTVAHTQPFIEHLHELRKRFYRMAASVIGFGALVYVFERPIIEALLKPARGQQFIYTSPGGGVDFLFRVCLYGGIALSIPIIVYQVLKYLQPLIKEQSARFIAWGSIISGLLALTGMVFGYFIGLPNALHFLLHQFVTQQIRPLVTIQSYIAFVTVYMLGSALLLQAPLILLFINRIKPLKPSGLLRKERWVILGAFIIAGLMNPTPNLLAQLIIVGPLIVTYQVGILLIWLINRERKQHEVSRELLARDEAVRAARQLKLAQSSPPVAPATPRPGTATPVTRIANPTNVVRRPHPKLLSLSSQRPARRPVISDILPG